MDAIGTFGAFRRLRKPLRAAGARVAAYQRFKWYRLSRLNNRTHRELLVVDGASRSPAAPASPTGGPGRMRGKPMWRDMMARIEGPVVSDIAGHRRRELAGVLRRDPDRAETYKPHRAAGDVAAFADQELAGRSRDGVARAVPDAGRRRAAARC